MSSILRALKKLENDSRHIEENPSLDTRFVSLADPTRRRSAFGFFFMAGTGIVCGLVVLAGWYLLSGRDRQLPPETATLSRPRSAPAPAAQSESRGEGVSHEKVAAPAAEKTSRQETVAGELAAAEPESAETIVPEEFARPVDTRNNVLHTDEVISREASKGEEIMSPAAGEPAAQPVEPAVVSAKSSVSPAADIPATEDEIPKLTDPGMKLQAITWSRVPEKRIAVINNRIVRENEPISGYVISTINQDDVELSRQGERWRLLFRTR